MQRGKTTKPQSPFLVVETGAESKRLDFFLYITVAPIFSKLREKIGFYSGVTNFNLINQKSFVQWRS